MVSIDLMVQYAWSAWYDRERIVHSSEWSCKQNIISYYMRHHAVTIAAKDSTIMGTI